MANFALISLAFFALLLLPNDAYGRTFSFVNNCPYTVWPATLTGVGSPLATTGFQLDSGASTSVDAPAGWNGRFWGRQFCSDATGSFSCKSGDCASGQVACNGAGGIPPATLIEFTLDGADGNDVYDVSLVDGFNMPMGVTPQGGNGCQSASCPANINSMCPPELQQVADDGSVVGCKSACEAFNTDEFCCRNAYNSPNTCTPSNYATMFKTACPQAYSYAYDDKTSTFTCNGGANYLITFCP